MNDSLEIRRDGKPLEFSAERESDGMTFLVDRKGTALSFTAEREGDSLANL